MKSIRSIAIHLPQFHAIPENDLWWGKGFTEWTNVKKSKPIFYGHNQPHVPLNNDYYDLSNLDSLHKQKDLAKEYGISGFCFYHYWFNGKLLLEKPLELILKDESWDFPFCLCWANENWTRTWDGQEKNVLMQQNYSIEDDILHFDYFIKFFKSHNYIKVDNKPVLLIYRSELFPNINETIDTWRKLATKVGLDGLYLIRVEGFKKDFNPQLHGFDAALDFQPDWSQLPEKLREPFISKILRRLKNNRVSQYYKNRVYSYQHYVEGQISNKTAFSKYKRYPCVMPSWDNSSRRKENVVILKDANPVTYKVWLQAIVSAFTPYSVEENFIFINAWNEWAEGNHLEPCEKWGHGYLKATKEILENFESNVFKR